MVADTVTPPSMWLAVIKVGPAPPNKRPHTSSASVEGVVGGRLANDPPKHYTIVHWWYYDMAIVAD